MAKSFHTIVRPVVPGFWVCLLLQILLLFQPEINDPTINESTNKLILIKASAFMVPGIVWSAWIVVSLFVVCPVLMESIIGFSGIHNKQLAISGLRLFGIPMSLFLLIEFFGYPARIIAGWTVFHYSLALFLSCLFDYKSQLDSRC
jgi:hypothetical protein